MYLLGVLVANDAPLYEVGESGLIGLMIWKTQTNCDINLLLINDFMTTKVEALTLIE